MKVRTGIIGLFFSACFCLAFLPLAVLAIMDAWKGQDIVRLARVIESGGTPDPDLFTKFEINGDIDAIGAKCADDSSRSALTVWLAGLDVLLPKPDNPSENQNGRNPAAWSRLQQSTLNTSANGLIRDLSGTPQKRDNSSETKPSADVAQIKYRADRALKAINQRLSCVPTDGNAWLYRARLLDQFGGDQNAVNLALQVSYWVAPAEKWIMSPRFLFVAPRIEAGDKTLFLEFSSEIMRIATRFTVQEIAELYTNSGANVRLMMAEAVRRLPERRKKDIVSAVDGLGVTMLLR